jgi:tRNA(fMet)-specific endonuclease VapC
MRFLLDTNVISDYVRGHTQVESHFMRCQKADLSISTMSIMEIEEGFLLSSRSRERFEHLTYHLIKDIHVLPFDQEVAIMAAKWRVLHSQSHPKTGSAVPSSNEDLIIAVTALTFGLTLVTHNTSDFIFFEGLELEDWTQP